MIRIILILIILVAFGCQRQQKGLANGAQQSDTVDYFPAKTDVRHARNFNVTYHGNYKVVRTSATLGDWGNANVERDDVSDVMVLVQRGTPSPKLEGDISHATIIEVPIEGAIGVNSSGLEIWMDMLGLKDRINIIGGTKTYDDTLRSAAMSGKIATVGYSWAAPPAMEVILQRKPGIFLMVISRVGFNESLDKLRNFDVKSAPVFDWGEQDYLGAAEWIKYCALFFNLEDKANALFDDIENNVEELKKKVANVPQKPLCLWANYVDAGFWLAQSNNLEARLMKDAALVNITEDFARPFSPVGESFTNEQLLKLASECDHWIISTGASVHLPSNRSFLSGFKAWREGNLYHHFKRSKPEFDAYDWYNLVPVRPDLALADLIATFHPEVLPAHETIFIGRVSQSGKAL